MYLTGEAAEYCWPLHCRSQALEKLHKCQEPDAGATGAHCGIVPEPGTKTFFLHCLSGALHWQSFTLCQLAQEKHLKGPGLCSWSQQKGWRGAKKQQISNQHYPSRTFLPFSLSTGSSNVFCLWCVSSILRSQKLVQARVIFLSFHQPSLIQCIFFILYFFL